MSLFKHGKQIFSALVSKKLVVKLVHGGFIRSFGWDKSLEMPSEGLLYIYEEMPDGSNRILAYADKFGRVFIENTTLERSPAKIPDLIFEKDPLYEEEGSIKLKNPQGDFAEQARYKKHAKEITLESEKFEALRSYMSDPLSKEDALTLAFIGLLPEFRNVVDAQESSLDSKEMPAYDYLLEVLQAERSVKDIVSIIENFNKNIYLRKKLGPRNEKYPSGTELYLYRLIEENAILNAQMPADELSTKMALSKLERTGLYYLIFLTPEISQELRLWGLGLESILNRIALSLRALKTDNPSEEQLALVDLDLIESIALQAPDFSDKAFVLHREQDPYTAWNNRVHFADLLESLKLPFRLETDFRLNASQDRALVQFRAPELELMPKLKYSRTLKTWLAQTKDEKAVEQSRYVSRLSSLIASCFYAANPYLDSLLIQAEIIDNKQEKCLVSFNLNRKLASDSKALAHQSPFEYIKTCSYESELKNNILIPQTDGLLSLNDPAYFNVDSFSAVERLHKDIPEFYQSDLHAQNTSELAIVEGINRLKYALELIYTNIGESASEKVSALLNLKKLFEDDEDLESAVDRTIAAIIDGSLENAEAYELAQYILAGSDLALSFMSASYQFAQGSTQKAYEILQEELDSLETDEPYKSSDTVRYHYFTNYLERIMFNKLSADDIREVVLVPDTYFESYMLAALCLLEMKNLSKAEEVLLRAQQLAPLNGRVANELARVYALQGKDTAAFKTLTEYLRYGCIPSEIGVSYLQLAHLLDKQQKHRDALICYALAAQIPSPAMNQAAHEYEENMRSNPSYENFDFESEVKRLENYGITLAPAKENLKLMEQAAKASVALEFFAPAYQILTIIGPISDNDLLYLVQQSLGLPQ